MKNSLDLPDNYDFGFTALTEEEIQLKAIQETSDKVDSIYKLVMPLLKNLLKDSDKEIIKWPNRKQKLEELIKRIEYIRNN